MTRLNNTLRGMALFTALGVTSLAQAEVINLKASLSGASEVPAKAVAGKGDLSATYDTDSKVLHWKLSFSGLTGDATAAHFHGPAAAGANAGVAVGFKGNINALPFESEATLTPVQADDLLAGKYYVNVHTAANPGGEIRGQVERVK